MNMYSTIKDFCIEYLKSQNLDEYFRTSNYIKIPLIKAVRDYANRFKLNPNDESLLNLGEAKELVESVFTPEQMTKAKENPTRFKIGDKVLVRDSTMEGWTEATFIAYDSAKDFPYIVCTNQFFGPTGSYECFMYAKEA